MLWALEGSSAGLSAAALVSLGCDGLVFLLTQTPEVMIRVRVSRFEWWQVRAGGLVALGCLVAALIRPTLSVGAAVGLSVGIGFNFAVVLRLLLRRQGRRVPSKSTAISD